MSEKRSVRERRRRKISEFSMVVDFTEFPGYAALIVRRTLADLNQPDNLLNLAHRVLGGVARWI